MAKQFDINKFNSFLDKAQKAISCGPDCQREKTAQELKNKYNAAQSNLILAEPQYQAAKRNYYTYVSGQGGYNEMVENELNKKVDDMIVKFNEITDEEIAKINSQIQIYDGLLLNFRNVVDLFKKYKIENIALFKELKNETNDILTNNRKTYYEDQENERLNSFYYYILLVIYIIVVICFIVFSLIYPSQTSLKTRIGLMILFIALPFIGTWIFGKIIYIIYWLFGLLPKNVYI
jgi:hypothetical protein